MTDHQKTTIDALVGMVRFRETNHLRHTLNQLVKAHHREIGNLNMDGDCELMLDKFAVEEGEMMAERLQSLLEAKVDGLLETFPVDDFSVERL